MANKRKKETILTVDVIDCDDCGKTIWEMEAHNVYETPFWEMNWNTHKTEDPHKELCNTCCPKTCSEADNRHG